MLNMLLSATEWPSVRLFGSQRGGAAVSGGMALGGIVLLAAVGPLELDEVIPVGVVAVTIWCFRRIPTSYLPTRGI